MRLEDPSFLDFLESRFSIDFQQIVMTVLIFLQLRSERSESYELNGYGPRVHRLQ